jgi:putative tryptophan/tyrosine transport system substrate-binding protein
MRRREFITLLGGAASTWPLGARAQQPERMPRVGVLMPFAIDNSQYQARVGAFLQGFQKLGRADGRNVQIEYRASSGNPDELRRYAEELVSHAPDVVLATGVSTVVPLQQATKKIPIVFAVVPDPVGAGIVDSLGHPGGNVTGFTTFEYGLSGKWLELLKEVAPGVMRVAVLRNPAISAGIGQFAAIQSIAPSLAVELTPMDVRDGAEIELAVSTFARAPKGGLIITGSALAGAHRDLLVALAAQYRLPAVYYERSFVDAGGLIAYGADIIEEYRLAAGYVDRIIKGEKAADLPVQAPTKYETAVNLKTARAQGIEIPPSVLARADEVIE